jgi:hypothetical protein
MNKQDFLPILIIFFEIGIVVDILEKQIVTEYFLPLTCKKLMAIENKN